MSISVIHWSCEAGMVYFFYPKFIGKKIEIWRLWLPYVSLLGLSKGARFRNILLIFKIISELGVFPFKSSWQLHMILKYHVRWWLLWKLHEYMKHAKPVTTSDVAALWLYWLTHLFFWKIFLSLFLFFPIHANYSYNPRNLILKWLIFMKRIQWLGTKDSGKNTTWNNKLLQIYTIHFVFLWLN